MHNCPCSWALGICKNIGIRTYFVLVTAESVGVFCHLGVLCKSARTCHFFLLHTRTAFFEAHFWAHYKSGNFERLKVTRLSWNPPTPLLHPIMRTRHEFSLILSDMVSHDEYSILVVVSDYEYSLWVIMRTRFECWPIMSCPSSWVTWWDMMSSSLLAFMSHFEYSVWVIVRTRFECWPIMSDIVNHYEYLLLMLKDFIMSKVWHTE